MKVWQGSPLAASAFDIYLIKDMLEYIINNQRSVQLHGNNSDDELSTAISEELFVNIGHALLGKNITIGEKLSYNYNRKPDMAKNKFLYKLIRQFKLMNYKYVHDVMYYDDLFPTDKQLHNELKLINNSDRMKNDNLFYYWQAIRLCQEWNSKRDSNMSSLYMVKEYITYKSEGYNTEPILR